MTLLTDPTKERPHSILITQHKNETVVKILRKNPEDFLSPYLTLADEPTGNLDSKTSAEMLGLIKRTSVEFRQTVVMITHNNDIARLADRIVCIEDGKIME